MGPILHYTFTATPRNARVASALALYPSTDKALPAGKPVTLRVPMLLSYASKRNNAQDVALTIGGDTRYPATVGPPQVHLASGSSAKLVATVQLTSGWSGVHAYTGDGIGRTRTARSGDDSHRRLRRACARVRVAAACSHLPAFTSTWTARAYSRNRRRRSPRSRRCSRCTATGRCASKATPTATSAPRTTKA